MAYRYIIESPRDNLIKLRELMADREHDGWSNWMKYLFECSTSNEDGSVTIPADKVERWTLQMNTDYNELSEKEKDSDRKEVDQTLDYIRGKI